MFLRNFLIEAYDQPWNIDIEGWAGAYWGVFNADRQLKFPLEGSVDPYGLARFEGQVLVSSPTDLADVNVLVRNIESSRYRPTR